MAVPASFLVPGCNLICGSTLSPYRLPPCCLGVILMRDLCLHLFPTTNWFPPILMKQGMAKLSWIRNTFVTPNTVLPYSLAQIGCALLRKYVTKIVCTWKRGPAGFSLIMRLIQSFVWMSLVLQNLTCDHPVWVILFFLHSKSGKLGVRNQIRGQMWPHSMTSEASKK